RFIDIENEGGLADLASASLDIGARGSENRGDVAVVVFGLVGDQRVLDFVDIERRRGRLRDVLLRSERAIGRARDAQRAGKGNEAERERERAFEPDREFASLLPRA